jgi:hypothetical protein
MFNTRDLIWADFETTGALNLKAAGTFRYAADPATRAVVLAYAIGDGPALAWHAGGAILDWDNAPDDLQAAFAGDAKIAAWNASFDSAIWNYATLGFPFLPPERVIDAMVQAGVSNLPTKLENASRYIGGEGKQKDGTKLIRLFCTEGVRPSDRLEEWQRFLAYACRDIDAMREVYRRTRPLPLAEWEQYWAFEHINRRGVHIDMPFVSHAAALAAEDGVAIGHRLSELTEGTVTSVAQPQRLAAWMVDQLDDAAMREVLIVASADDDDTISNGNGDDDDGSDEE